MMPMKDKLLIFKCKYKKNELPEVSRERELRANVGVMSGLFVCFVLFVCFCLSL